MQTATLKKALEELGISFDDIVHYRKHGNKATIEIDLKLLYSRQSKILLERSDTAEDKAQRIITPEEEFRHKYPEIKINRPELFELVGCLADVPSHVSDRDLIIDAIENKYER